MYNNQNSNPFGILNGRKPVQQAQGGLQVQTPQSQVQPDQPGAMDQMGNYAMNKGMDASWNKGVEAFDAYGAEGLQGVQEAFGPAGNSLTNGVMNGGTGLTSTGAGSQAAMLAEQGMGAETLATLQGTAGGQAATLAGEGGLSSLVGSGATAAVPEVAAALAPAAATTTAVGTGTALAGGATAAGAMFPPLLIGGLILSSMFS